MDQEINLVSTVENYTGGKNTIHPLDPQTALYKEGCITETITEANNMLDMYNPEEKYYHFSISNEYKQEVTDEITYFLEQGYLNESEINKFPYIYHRGLMYVDLKLDIGYEALLIDVLCIGNELIRAVIVDTLRAIELARITNNCELIGFLHATDTYVKVSEIVQYDHTNKELYEENRELKQEIKTLKSMYESLKLEYDGILESLRVDFDNKQDNEALSYMESLEIQNKKLEAKIKEYEEKDLKHKQTLRELRNMIDNFNTELFSQ